MEPRNARDLLRELVVNYVKDLKKQAELIAMIFDNRYPIVPVRRVLTEIDRCETSVSSEDSEAVKDLDFNF